MIFLLTKNKMTTTHTSFSKIMSSIDLRRKIFHFKSLSKKKQVHENYSLIMAEFKNHIKSYINFFNEWKTIPSWIDDVKEEEPLHDFVDIVNDIYNSNSPYHYKDTAYSWLFLGIQNSVHRLPVSTPKDNPTSW